MRRKASVRQLPKLPVRPQPSAWKMNSNPSGQRIRRDASRAGWKPSQHISKREGMGRAISRCSMGWMLISGSSRSNKPRQGISSRAEHGSETRAGGMNMYQPLSRRRNWELPWRNGELPWRTGELLRSNGELPAAQTAPGAASIEPSPIPSIAIPRSSSWLSAWISERMCIKTDLARLPEACAGVILFILLRDSKIYYG